MNAQIHETTTEAHGAHDGRGRMVGGSVMLVAGLLLLVAQFFTVGSWFLVALGLVFLVAGVVTRTAGWFIPGGILEGVGFGALAIESGLVRGDTVEGGAFLLIFALGWASIYVLTRIFTAQPLRWALIPGAILAAIGGLLLLGEVGLSTLATVSQALAYVWPLALIAAGVAVILRGRRR